MEQKLLIITFLALLHLDRTFCANILVLQPSRAKSHSQFIKPLAEEIIKRGHNLTFVSKFQLSDTFRSNYTLVSLEKSYQNITANAQLEKLVTKSTFGNLLAVFTITTGTFQASVQSPEMKKIFLSEDHYDLIIAEFFLYDAYFALGSKFNAPVMGFISQPLFPFQNWIIGQEFPASYVPNTFFPFTEVMNLMSRINNAVLNIFSILYYEFFQLPYFQENIERYFHFAEGKAPHIRDVLKNVSVFLVNAHSSFGYTKPELPNVVPVAGLHLTPAKPLPKNIQKFMDDAKYGVIYLSLGSVVSADRYQSLGETFIRTLENVEQKLIMKWDRKLLPYIPSNMLVQEWLPQSDILNHPNCRLFVSHGGLLGLLESLNASVPVIGIPFFSDQPHNLAILEYYKIGMALQLEDVSSKFLEKVKEVLKNPIYKQNIERRSRLFRDRLVRPLDEAMYWVDHLIKHKDMSYLRPASTELAWYQLYSLDVAIILIVSFLSIWYLIIKISTILLLMMSNRIFLKARTEKRKGKTE